MGKWKVYAIEVTEGQTRAVVDRIASRARKLKYPIRGILAFGHVQLFVLIEATKLRDVILLTRGVKDVTRVLKGQKGRDITETYSASDRDLEEYCTGPGDYFTDVISVRG